VSQSTPLHDLVAQAGGVFREDAGWLIPDHFGDATREYHQARSGCALFDVSHRGKVELTGDDAVTFLHNLATNDVKGLSPGTGCEALLTTAKAKVVSHLLIYRTESALWLDLAPGTSETVIRHLDHFLISEAVEIIERTRDFAQLHLAGPTAHNALATVIRDLPTLGELQHFEVHGTSVRRHDPLGLPGYDLMCPRAEAKTLWERLVEARASPAGKQAFEILRVEAGTPAKGLEIDENTFAPEVGRTAQAICYTKGCYLGQEPIVMARDRGQVNRTLLGLKVAGGLVPPGSLLHREGKEVGRVTSCVVSPRLGTIALAYIRRGHQEPGTAVEGDVAGQRQSAVVTALPFSA
jgi:folate-binding protein YgfZ